MHLSGPVCPICCCFYGLPLLLFFTFLSFFEDKLYRVTPNFQVIGFLRITLLVHKYHFLPVKLVGIFQSLNKWNEGNELLWQADSDKVPKDTIQNCFLLICLLCLVTTLLLPLMPVWAWIKPGDVALPPWKQTERNGGSRLLHKSASAFKCSYSLREMLSYPQTHTVHLLQ